MTLVVFSLFAYPVENKTMRFMNESALMNIYAIVISFLLAPDDNKYDSTVGSVDETTTSAVEMS